MARQANAVFLEEWLRNSCGSSAIAGHLSSTSARGIIQAWAELRDLVQRQSFEERHLQSLKTLVDSQVSLHVADPQAKLLVSVLSSRDLVLPDVSYPSFLRLLYIWVRKSFKPSSALVDSAVEAISNLFATNFSSKKRPEFFSEGVLLLGAVSLVSSASEASKTACLKLLCQLIEREYSLLRASDRIVPDVLAGCGYALCSSANIQYARILDALLGIWGKEDGPFSSIPHGLMVLHLVEWVISSYISSQSQQKLQIFYEATLVASKSKYTPFATLMAAAGILRALNKSAPGGQMLNIISYIRIAAESQLEYVARELISKTGGFSDADNDSTTNLLLQCIALALSRSRLAPSSAPLFISLATALVKEIFPLQRLFSEVLESTLGTSELLTKVNEHLDSVQFKEAGVISSVFCNQYLSADDESKNTVEKIIWSFCRELYLGHRKVASLLHGREDQLLGQVEKIAESAFLMVVVFALAVTKHKLNSNSPIGVQIETSVSILSSFTCIEYFRRIRLPEYMDAIRSVVKRVQENEAACVSYVESMPVYTDLTNPRELTQKTEYVWFRDEVQTAHILFYLRVIPTCIECLPAHVFSKLVAPTMFLYMGHPNGKVARAAHSVFSAFVCSGEDSDNKERTLLKEKLAFYYVQRSLEGYPGITPFKGMASGVAALARNLPGGSPAAFYCVHSLIKKAERLCSDIVGTTDPDYWKNWQGEPNPPREIMELLLRLLSLVDIQVLPNLMKSLVELVVQLPKDGQNAVLNELYAQVADSDDATRKPALVSWLQSVSYVCSQVAEARTASKGTSYKNESSAKTSKWGWISARLLTSEENSFYLSLCIKKVRSSFIHCVVRTPWITLRPNLATYYVDVNQRLDD